MWSQLCKQRDQKFTSQQEQSSKGHVMWAAYDINCLTYWLLASHVERTETNDTITTLQPFHDSWNLSRTTQVSQYQKGKTNLDLLEQEIESGSGISTVICKSAPRPRQITTQASHHSVFLQAGCPSWHLTNSIKELKANDTILAFTTL